MADYTIQNLKALEDSAVGHGLSPQLEARFAKGPLECEQSGLSYQRLAPNFRVPFAHRHKTQEEIYVVVNGSVRMKLEDEVIELRQWDAIRVPKETMRGFESGAEGVEIIAIGAPNTGPGDAEVEQGWWSD